MKKTFLEWAIDHGAVSPRRTLWFLALTKWNRYLDHREWEAEDLDWLSGQVNAATHFFEMDWFNKMLFQTKAMLANRDRVGNNKSDGGQGT